jgi:hypothetical protein
MEMTEQTPPDKALVERLRDTDSYYRIQEKHWCIDAEELERQRLTAADRIEAQAAEIERLREALKDVIDQTIGMQKWEWHHAVIIARAALGEQE